MQNLKYATTINIVKELSMFKTLTEIVQHFNIIEDYKEVNYG